MPSRIVLAVALLVTCAACGIERASAGVDAVESRSAPGADRADVAQPDPSLPAGRSVDVGPVRGDANAGGEVTLGTGAAGEIVSGGRVVATPRTVAVVGDSLTVAAEDELTAELTALGLEVVAIDGLVSRRMDRGGSSLPPGTDAIADILAGSPFAPPDLWVVALGTNDVGGRLTPEEFRADMGAVLALIPEQAPVVWVDLWIRDREDAIVEANRSIRTVLARRASPSAVVDWFSQGAVPGVISGDGVHPTELGQQRFADAIAAVVGAMLVR